jgi:hypothetical protein
MEHYNSAQPEDTASYLRNHNTGAAPAGWRLQHSLAITGKQCSRVDMGSKAAAREAGGTINLLCMSSSQPVIVRTYVMLTVRTVVLLCLWLQIMGSNAAQLTAAVSALINALVASKFSTQGALGLMNTISYARWGLEGYVIAEANCLKGECKEHPASCT